MYKRDDNKPKAVWNRIHNITVGEGAQAQRYDFDLSEGGSVRVMLNTPAGERQAFMFPAAQLEHVIAVQSELPRIFEAFQSIQPDIQIRKEKQKEQDRLERQKLQELNKRVQRLSALDQEKARILADVEALTGKKLA